MDEKRLELRVDIDRIILNLWRVEDNKTKIKLKGEDGELTMILNAHADAEGFLKQAVSFIKELGI